MDTQIEERVARMEQKIDAIYVSVEKTRNYFKWTLIISVVMIVLPILLSLILVPILMNTVSSMYGELGVI